MTEANRDEARKCLAIARQCIAEDQLEKAEKFAAKAQRLYSSVEVGSLQGYYLVRMERLWYWLRILPKLTGVDG